MLKKVIVIISFCICSVMLTSCLDNDTYKLARKMYDYKLNKTGYKQTLKMAQKGNYDANCRDCFKGLDTSNSKFCQTPLLAAVNGNRNNKEIIKK